MSIKKELRSLAGAKREIENRAKRQSFAADFIKNCKCDLDNKSKRRLNYTYGIVKRIDSKLKNNTINNVNSALRLRSVACSMTKNYMIRYKFVDVDILEAENISIDQLGESYNIKYHQTEFIAECIQNNKFIQNKIIELAKEGKPFITKNRNEIRDIEEELDILDKNLKGATKVESLFWKAQINSHEENLQRLKQEDFTKSQYSIEDICFKIVSDCRRNTVFMDDSNIFNGNDLKDTLWYFSETAQNKLIDLIVRTYKEINKSDIYQDRINRNKEYKKEFMKKYNKKDLSAQDKRELIKIGKAEGNTKKEIAMQIGCSVRTVQINWDKV